MPRCGCGAENREGAKFCGACGARLEQRCRQCGVPLVVGLKFCDECGTAVADGAGDERVPGGASRKSVTVVFVDLGGSTAFGEAVDAETARTVMGRYHSLVTEAVETHGGTVAKYIGDGVMVLFGVPEVAEDDAVRAVAFGADVQERFAPFAERVEARHGETVTLRVGVNTGEIVIGEEDVDLYGDALNVAARLEKACPHGGVLVGEETWRLARNQFAFEAKGDVEVHGRSGAVRPYLLVLDAEVEERTAPFVGRNDELDRLGRLFARTVTDRRPALASVVGPPGVGKTRLSRELQKLVGKDGAGVYTTACDRHGDATFGPIADLLRPDDVADPDAVRSRLMELLDGDPDALRVVEGLLAVLGSASKKVSVEETFWAVRRLVERLGRDAPVVVVVDDIQWASEQLLDLFEHLVSFVNNTALLLVTLARPEIRELRPVLAETGRPVDELVLLTGLDADSTATLAARLLGGDELPRGLADRLPASTDGNPLFVREVVRMLVDEEIVRNEGERWVLTVEPDAIDVPSTVQSLLAARVERLPAEERAVLERAAVIGSDFTRGGLEHLCTAAERSALPRVLRSLTRKELIEAAGSYWGDDPVNRFHHVLIRDAVYRRLLKETRAGLHERIGAWMELASAEVLGEHDAAIGHHFEQAFHYRSDLDDDPTALLALGARAAAHLADAARVALRDDDAVAAGTVARRALACLAPEGPTRPETLTLACEALLEVGDAAAARPFIDELRALADLEPTFAGWAKAYDAQAITIAEPDRLADAEVLATEAVAAMADLDDPSGRAKARLVRAAILARRGRIGECEAELDVALTEARAAKDTRRVVAVLGVAPLAALWGPSPVARAGGRCLDVLRLLRITASSPAVEAVALRCQAVLEALRGRFDTAYSLIERARDGISELGLRRELADIAVARGQIHLLAGDPAAAEEPLRTAHEDLLAIGAGAEASQAAALLGRTLVRLGRSDEVEAFVDEAEQLAGENLKAAILGRTVRAEWLLAAGRDEEARTVARRAVAIAETTDLVLDHAEACDVLDAIGEATRTAAELRERKGVAAVGDASPVADATVAPADDTPDERAEPIPATRGRGRGTDTETSMRASIERMTAAWRAGDRAAWQAQFGEGAVVDVRRAVGANSTSGAAALEAMWSLRDALPCNPTRIESTSDRGVARGSVRFHDDAGNEVEMCVVIEFDSTALVERLTTFDGDDRQGAEALFRQRVEQRSDDPLDRINFVVPELRRVVEDTPYGETVAAVGQAWQAGDDDRLAWLYGRDDVVVDNRKSTVDSGTTAGADVAELMQLTRAFFPVVERVEILAVRGDRYGVTHGVYSGGDAVEEFLLVGEVDGDGRIVRQVVLDPDAITEADALLDEWFWSSDEAVFERQVAVGRRLMDAQHDPSRRDDLRDVLSEDFTYRYPSVLGDRTFGRDEYIDLIGSFMDTDDHGVEDWQAWAVWGEPLSERVLLSVVRRRARMADGTTPEWLWVGVIEMRDGQIRRFELLPIEELEHARRLALDWNGAGAFGELPAPLVGVPFVDTNHWNAAVRWRLRMLAWLNDRERDLSASLVRDDVTVHDRRPLFRTDLTTLDDVLRHGAEMVGIAGELIDTGILEQDPFQLVGVIDTADEPLCLTAEFVAGVGDMLQVIEVDDQNLLLRNATFEPEQIEEARATLAEWHAESTSPPSDDPLDLYEFVVPELRRVADGTPYAELGRLEFRSWQGDDAARAYVYGRDDVRLDDHRSVVNLGVAAGASVGGAVEDFAEIYTRWVDAEIVALRGTRFGVCRVTFATEDGNEYACLAVDEADREGRAVRSTYFDSDRVMEAIALLDEWYLESDEAVTAGLVAVGSRILATQHKPSHRDELLAVLSEDVVVRFADGLVSWGELSRDEYLGIIDSFVEEADRIDNWAVWAEPLSASVGLWVGRRIATMPDGTTPEWIVTIVGEIRDGQVRSIDVFPIEDVDRARAHARTLNGLGAYGQVPAPLADLPVVESPGWNDAARTRLRFYTGGEEAVAAADDLAMVDRRPLNDGEVTGPAGRRKWLAAVRETIAPAIAAGTIPPDPGRLISVLAVSGERHCLLHEAIIGGTDWLTVYEIDDAGHELRLVFYEPEQVDEALAEFRSWTATDETGDDGADPLDRIGFPFPELRAIVEPTPYAALADFVEAYASGNEERLAWFFGRDDLVVESRLSTINSGTSVGPDAAELPLVTRKFFPDPIGNEILAVRGPRHGSSRCTYRDEEGNHYEFIAVIEVDDDGRVIRQVLLDPEAIIEAVELLDAWYVSSPGAIGHEAILAGSSLLHSTCDPARRDELLSRLDDEYTVRMMSGASLLDDLDRDAFLAIQDALIQQAEHIAFWCVWAEPVTDDVVFAVLRRLATMPDGSTAEWLVATANVYRDGRLRLVENFDISEFEQARQRTLELAAGDQAETDPLDLIDFVVPALRKVIEDTPYGRALATFVRAWSTGDDDLLAWFFGRDDLVSEDRRSTVHAGTTSGAEEVALVLAARELAPILASDEIVAIRGTRHGATRLRMADDSGSYVDFISVVEVDEEGRATRQTYFDDDAITEAVELLDEWYVSSPDAIEPELTIAGSSASHSACDPARRDEHLERLDDDFTSRRSNGSSLLVDDLDRDAFVAFQDALIDQAERFHFWAVWTEPHGHGVDFAVLRGLAAMPDGSTGEWLIAAANVYRDGRLLLSEHFDISEIERARQRSAELAALDGSSSIGAASLTVRPHRIATTHPGDTPHVSTEFPGETQSLALREVNDHLKFVHDQRAAGVRDERVVGPTRDRFAPDFRRIDHRPLGTDVLDGAEAERSTQILADLGFVMAGVIPIAARGEHQTLGIASVQSDDNEMLSGVGQRYQADGLISVFDVFDPSDTLAAYHRMLDRYLADEDDDADAGWVAIDRAFVDALGTDDRRALRAVFADDLRATLADGTEVDADGYTTANLAFRNAVPESLTWIANMRVIGNRAIAEIVTADLTVGLDGHEWFHYAIWERRDGRISSAEHHDDLIAALARFTLIGDGR